MMVSKRVVVLLGGTSDEREVSLRSGAAVVDALDASGVQVDTFDPRFGVQALARAVEPSGTIVFNALHGGTGENGSVQGLLEVMGVPYTHSGVRASALAMDKPASRDIFAAHGLNVANGLVVCRDELAARDPMPRPIQHRGRDPAGRRRHTSTVDGRRARPGPGGGIRAGSRDYGGGSRRTTAVVARNPRSRGVLQLRQQVQLRPHRVPRA